MLEYRVTDRDGNVVLPGDEIIIGNSTGIFETVTRGPESGLGALVVVSGHEYYAKMIWGLDVTVVTPEAISSGDRLAWLALKGELAEGTVQAHEQRTVDIADQDDGTYSAYKAMINGD